MFFVIIFIIVIIVLISSDKGKHQFKDKHQFWNNYENAPLGRDKNNDTLGELSIINGSVKNLVAYFTHTGVYLAGTDYKERYIGRFDSSGSVYNSSSQLIARISPGGIITLHNPYNPGLSEEAGIVSLTSGNCNGGIIKDRQSIVAEFWVPTAFLSEGANSPTMAAGAAYAVMIYEGRAGRHDRFYL